MTKERNEDEPVADEGLTESSHHDEVNKSFRWRPVLADSGTHWTHWVPLNPEHLDRSRGPVKDAE